MNVSRRFLFCPVTDSVSQIVSVVILLGTSVFDPRQGFKIAGSNIV